MKKGFFSLLFLAILTSPMLATAKAPGLDVRIDGETMPKGAMEDFYQKFKEDCAAGVEPNSEEKHVKSLTCIRGTILWGIRNYNRKVNLPNACWMDAYVDFGMDFGGESERYTGPAVKCSNHGGELESPLDIDEVSCPQFYQFHYYEKATRSDITCEDVADSDTAKDYCGKILAEDGVAVFSVDTGRNLDICINDPTGDVIPPMPEDPITIPGAPDCSGDTQPVPESCCNGQGEMPTAEACQDACNSIPPQDIGNYPYCCDDTVTPRPAVCDLIAQSPDGPWPNECGLFIPGYDLEMCCGTDWGVGDSPEPCKVICTEADNRAEHAWCCDGTVQPTNSLCTEEPEPDPCEASPTDPACEEPTPPDCEASPTDPACQPEPDPCDASPTDPACQPEPDPCDASPTGEGCQEPDPGECAGEIHPQFGCVPTAACLAGLDDEIREECCNTTTYDTQHPEHCRVYCKRSAEHREASSWCCDGTLHPAIPECGSLKTSLTQKDLNSMLKTLGMRL